MSGSTDRRATRPLISSPSRIPRRDGFAFLVTGVQIGLARNPSALQDGGTIGPYPGEPIAHKRASSGLADSSHRGGEREEWPDIFNQSERTNPSSEDSNYGTFVKL